MRTVVYALLVFLYALHTDVWYWDDPRPLLGAPVGFSYHVLWTLAVSGAFWLAVRFAWPAHLERVEPAADTHLAAGARLEETALVDGDATPGAGS